ncbi:MAG: hypothetical protein U0073_00010 [Bacteroidia bacterium]|jgi:hypothetical protein
MKIFKVNFKLQHVAGKLKPVQVVLSLNTKYNGKYLTVEKATGISLNVQEWDASRRLPKDPKLSTKFIRLEKEILEWLNFLAEDHISEGGNYEDFEEKIIDFHQRKVFQYAIDERIKRVIRGEVNDFMLTRKTYYDNKKVSAGEFFEIIKERMETLKYSIVDEAGRLVDIEKFLSNYGYKPEELLVEAPNKVIVRKTAPTHEIIHQDERYNVPFYQFINDVADKKVKRQLLKEEGAKDYKLKLSAQFKQWDDKITIGEMTDDISAEFFYWLMDTNDFGANYYANFKKWMKAVLRWAKIEDKLQLPHIEPNSLVYQQNKEKVSFPYLTEEMLGVLINMQFDPSEKHLEYTRDLFYLASYTGGLTFGDLSQAFHVQSRNVDGHKINFVSVTRTKTRIEAEIPLLDSVFDILKKYDFKFKEISNQHYNKNIQRVCELAGFTDNFTRTRLNIRTKMQEPVTIPFYQLIGSHTARRNFCSNFFYHRNIDALTIMQFSQHVKLESFLNYVKASAKVKFDEFAKKVIISDRKGNGEPE